MNKILLTISALLLVALFALQSFYSKERQTRIRTENNLNASLSEIETYKNKNGELVSVVQGYEFKVREFEKLLPELYAEIKELKVKVKNAQSVTQIETKIVYRNKDSIVYIPVRDSTARLFPIDDEWIKAEVIVTRCEVILPGDFYIKNIPNKTTLVPEVTYKGWWFWRKPVGIDLHIKQSNPYVQTTGATYIDLRK